jgi:hypothetical protein
MLRNVSHVMKTFCLRISSALFGAGGWWGNEDRIRGVCECGGEAMVIVYRTDMYLAASEIGSSEISVFAVLHDMLRLSLVSYALF